jgi:electron transfer flavoprotein alpha subunit
MPNLLVPIDLREGVPTAPSLFALSEARRVARQAGVTVFAVVLTAPRPEAEVHEIAARLGVAGADKVLLCERTGLDAPALDATHGPLLQHVAERVPPLIVLFPAGGAGLQLGAPLAARLGAAFAAVADLEVSGSPTPLPDSVGRVYLRRWHRDSSAYRRLDPVELERPVIAVLSAQGEPRAEGTPNVEVQALEGPTAPAPAIVEREALPDEDVAISLARVLVLVDPEVGAERIAALTAAAPAGVTVVDLARVSPAALAVCAPRVLVHIRASADSPSVAQLVSPSPRTRVGVVHLGAGESPVPGRSDVVWRADGPDALSALAAALPGLAAAAGGAA